MDLAFCSDPAFFFPRISMFLGFRRGVFCCCPCSSLLSICGRGCAFEVGGEWQQELAPCSQFLLWSPTYSVVIFSSPFWKFLVSCLKIASRERGLIAYQHRPSPAVLFQLLPGLEMAVLELSASCTSLSVSPVLTCSTVYPTLQAWFVAILSLRPFLNSQAALYTLSFFWKMTHLHILSRAALHGGSSGGKIAWAVCSKVATVAAPMEAVPELRELLGKANKLLQFWHVTLLGLQEESLSKKEKSSRKGLPKVAFTCELLRVWPWLSRCKSLC